MGDGRKNTRSYNYVLTVHKAKNLSKIYQKQKSLGSTPARTLSHRITARSIPAVPLPVTDWSGLHCLSAPETASKLLCTGGRRLKPSLVLLSPLRIESAFLPIMKPISRPEQRLEVSGNYRSPHKKAGASRICIVSSLAIHVWGPIVMTLWLRCCKAKFIDQRLPGD